MARSFWPFLEGRPPHLHQIVLNKVTPSVIISIEDEQKKSIQRRNASKAEAKPLQLPEDNWELQICTVKTFKLTYKAAQRSMCSLHEAIP